jgi:hypothetical protein
MIFALTIALCGVAFGSAAVHEGVVACSVCRHAIEELWHIAADLKTQCAHDDNETKMDHACHLSHLADTSLIAHVTEVCDLMSYKYGVHENTIHLERRAHNDAETASSIAETCSKWLLADHNAETLSLYISSNVNAGKEAEQILPRLQHRFCMKACNMGPIPDRRIKHGLQHREHHNDFTYAHSVEQKRMIQDEL